MGAWDTDPFGNDTACDWIYTLEQSEGLELIEETLEKVVSLEDEYLESPDAEEALAAADAIARLKGHAYVKNSYTETLDEWVARQETEVPQDLVDLALQAIDRILTEPSELLELWEESEQFEAWKKQLDDLKGRLK